MKRKGSLLIVEGDRSLRTALQRLLMPRFEEVVATSSPVILPKLLAEKRWRALLLEVGGTVEPRDGKEGLYWLHEALRLQQKMPVVLSTTYTGLSLAVQGVAEGAVEFVVKPCEIQKLARLLVEVADADEAASIVHDEPVPPQSDADRSEATSAQPLSQEEVLPTAERLIARFCRTYGRRPMTLSKEAAALLSTYPWNGNIDELAYTVEKAVILCDSRELPAELFPLTGWVRQEKKAEQETPERRD